MAKKWYLMNGTDRYSGFENDDFESQAQEGFNEILSTFLRKELELYSSDLLQKQNIRCIVQKNVENTELSSMEREILVPIGSCKAGMYFKYQDLFWMVTGLVDNNMMYEKALVLLCQYYLKWQNSNGDIIGRWVNVISNAQYNSGTTNSSKGTNMILQSDQLMLTAPFDDDVLSLKEQMRLIISYKKSMPSAYEITRLDSVPYAYGDNGIVPIIVTQTPLQPENDNLELGICNYTPFSSASINPIKEDIIKIIPKIKCSSKNIIVGTQGTKFFATFTDSDGNELRDIKYHWEIVFEKKEDLTIKENENYILIKTSNEEFIDSKLKLILSLDNESNTKTEIIIDIISMF